METDAVELLARSGGVKAWREGTDLHITVPAEAPEEDFKRVITVMGLEVRMERYQQSAGSVLRVKAT